MNKWLGRPCPTLVPASPVWPPSASRSAGSSAMRTSTSSCPFRTRRWTACGPSCPGTLRVAWATSVFPPSRQSTRSLFCKTVLFLYFEECCVSLCVGGCSYCLRPIQVQFQFAIPASANNSLHCPWEENQRSICAETAPVA